MSKENFLKRFTDGIKYTITGVKPDGWMGPGQPIAPIAQEAEGRQFDYNVSTNLQQRPRANEPIDFPQLRRLSENCDILRAVIETKKDEIARFKWSFKQKSGKGTNRKCEELNKFFTYPNRVDTFGDWVRQLVEDQLVIDAATIYPRKTLGGQMYSLEIMDGATIKPLIDDTGRIPTDGVSPSYQQYLKGIAAVDYTFDDIVYAPRNKRSNKIYGYSPVEQIANTVNIALLKQTSQINYYLQGNMPNYLFRAPDAWNSEQIIRFQKIWDNMNAGENRSRGLIIPGGLEPINIKPMANYDEFDHWLAKIIFFTFGVTSQSLINDINRATAETAADIAMKSGTLPLLDWIRDLINGIVSKHWGYDDIEFVWDLEEQTDPIVQAQVDQIYLTTGVKTINEVREGLGLDPLSEEELEAMKPAAPSFSFDSEEGNEADAEKFYKKKRLKKI